MSLSALARVGLQNGLPGNIGAAKEIADAIDATTNGTNPFVTVAGLTGATAVSRYVGATASGAPLTGTFAVGDFIIDQTGAVWVCTAAGTPGTWLQANNVITSASATAEAVGPNGSTTPTWLVDCSTASAVTGLKLKSAAAGAGVAITVISSGGQANEALTVDAKGAGALTLGGVSTGALNLGGTTTTPQITLAANVTGGTSPAIRVLPALASTTLTAETQFFQVLTTGFASVTTGYATQRCSLFQAPGFTAGTVQTITTCATVAISGPPTSSGSLTITTPLALWVQAGTALFAGAVQSNSPTAGIGYTTGAGGTQTQGVSKATTVVLNAICGTITLNAAALAGDTTVAFTLTNSAIAGTDCVHIQHDSAGTLGAYTFGVTPGTGSAVISVHNCTAGSLAEAIVLRFCVIKAVIA